MILLVLLLLIYITMIILKSYIDKNADLVQRFTNAVYKAQQWIASHTDREVAEAIAHQFPDTSLDLLETVTARHRRINAWNTTLVMAQLS